MNDYEKFVEKFRDNIDSIIKDTLIQSDYIQKFEDDIEELDRIISEGSMNSEKELALLDKAVRDINYVENAEERIKEKDKIISRIVNKVINIDEEVDSRVLTSKLNNYDLDNIKDKVSSIIEELCSVEEELITQFKIISKEGKGKTRGLKLSEDLDELKQKIDYTKNLINELNNELNNVLAMIKN